MKQIFLGIIALSFLTAYTVFAGPDSNVGNDRLDGNGASHVKVQVIEWERNLELRVYPKGSLQGLGLKLDQRIKNKPVMVLSYRFSGKTMIRREILGIDLKEDFKTFKDPSENEFDKIVISNDSQDLPIVPYPLDQAPSQLYPDGYAEALAKSKILIASAKANTHRISRAPAEEDSDSSINDSDDEVSSLSEGVDGEGGSKTVFLRDGGGRGFGK